MELDAIGVGLLVVTIGSVLGATSQGTATLIAAVIAAVASLATLVAQLGRWWGVRKRRSRLTKLLAEGETIRSLEWLGRRLGMSESEVAAMLPDVKAHGVKMEGNKEGAALDSRHRGG
jgi:biotin operon repressor